MVEWVEALLSRAVLLLGARILIAERLRQNDFGSERSWNLFSAGSMSFPLLRRMGHRGIGLVQLAAGRDIVLGMGPGLGECWCTS